MGSSTPAGNASRPRDWPALDPGAASDTYATLHLWTQIVGKIRLAQTPWLNHSWHVALYLTARGLATSPIAHGARLFQIDFDFIAHRLRIQTGEGASATLALAPGPVAGFCRAVLARLRPAGAGYDATLREFILPYEAVRRADAPDGVLLDFLQSSYEAAADLGQWDRARLEYAPARPY